MYSIDPKEDMRETEREGGREREREDKYAQTWVLNPWTICLCV